MRRKSRGRAARHGYHGKHILRCQRHNMGREALKFSHGEGISLVWPADEHGNGLPPPTFTQQARAPFIGFGF